MKSATIKHLQSLITDETPKKTCDLLQFAIRCVREHKGEEKEDVSMLVEVLGYLNEKAGTKYKPVESNLKFIRARLKDYSVADLKAVVDRQVAKWKGTSMQMYLRPETLFNATKFETYHNGLANENKTAKSTSNREYAQQDFTKMFASIDTLQI
ncbi:conserved phage C-terminal domain-containing protein [bacterium]|nr:conserved phage C-terminal domain-containing protein [bacterium]